MEHNLRRRHWGLVKLKRLQTCGQSIALFLGAIALWDVLQPLLGWAGVSALNHHPAPLSAWWFQLATLSAAGRLLVLLTLAGTLLSYAWRPRMGSLRRRASQLVAGLVLLRCAVDAIQVFLLHARGAVPNPLLLPLSLWLALACSVMLWAITTAPEPSPTASNAQNKSSWTKAFKRRLPICIGAIVSAQLFAFAQMQFLGKSDYRRRADAVVVFGARVYRNGRPSTALADRVRTAARLVVKGYAPLLIVSGGPGDGDIHEVEAMRDLAIAVGVPRAAIVMDRDGWNTRATVDNSAKLLAARKHSVATPRVLAVSHSYHLPRIKLSYQQRGIVAYTVPAHESRTLLRLPWYVARETIAFWAHAFLMA